MSEKMDPVLVEEYGAMSKPMFPGPTGKDIEVSCCGKFPQNRWREAILDYLFAVWSAAIMWGNPSITFGGLTLCLDTNMKRYFAYGRGADELSAHSVPAIGEAVLHVENSQLEVQDGLIRFVKNEKIRTIVLHLQRGSMVILWKRARRGEYGCWSSPEVPERFVDFG